MQLLEIVVMRASLYSRFLVSNLAIHRCDPMTMFCAFIEISMFKIAHFGQICHKRMSYPSFCKPSEPITEFDVDIVDLEVVPGAREKSVALSVLSLSKFGNFH